MRVALLEAGKGLGRTSPNPAVGAILVAGNRIVARGHHRGPGKAHAEIECLRGRKRISRNDTLFVTLEPCSTTGRTGPCTDAIIKSGVRNVVIGSVDLNPRHQGRGIKLLEKAGINVRTGVLSEECKNLNEHFNKWIVTGLPFVIAKCGMSLDGRLTRPPNESQWLTSATSRRHAHALRTQVDAILVGAETVRRDNPRLTVRGVGDARQPLRVVLTRSGKVPRQARVFKDRPGNRTLIYRNKSLPRILVDLGKQEITSVLIEGGSEILGHALDTAVIDKIQIYIAPLFTGGPVGAFGGRGAANTAEAARVEHISFGRIGDDICIIGYPRYGGKS